MTPRSRTIPILVMALALSLWIPATAQEPEADEEIVLKEALALGRVGTFGRVPLHMDPIEERIVLGTWQAPEEGETVESAARSFREEDEDNNERKWEKIEADENGWFTDHRSLRGGYLYFSLHSPRDRVMLLDAQGHNLVYVNGKLRPGDPYSYGHSRFPVALKQGANELLFGSGRGRLRAVLKPLEKPVFFGGDQTLPGLVIDEKTDTQGALIMVNAMSEPLRGAVLESELLLPYESWSERRVARVALPTIIPLTVRKVGFPIVGPAPTRGPEAGVQLRLFDAEGNLMDTANLKLPIVGALSQRDRTFVSEIDGSVQYYSVKPAQPVTEEEAERPALFLSTHGASVEARGQAGSYNHKTWGHIVAPTNRRPYGFDWEEWGRIDAMEVLAKAKALLNPDPSRIYVTGHSMGGHGAWYLGVTYPDQWGAIGPCSGWRSFWTYSRRWQGEDEEEPSAMEQMIRRATGPSDIVTSLSLNLKHLGVYVLHGEKDDNVPVEEAREMVKFIDDFHSDWVYHEQPGAGHWWGGSDEPGAECQDWPPMYDFFARHSRSTNASKRRVEFHTANPVVSSTCYWAGIEAQFKHSRDSWVDIQFDPGLRRFVGTTGNVARLSLDVAHMAPARPILVNLDGAVIEKIAWPETGSKIYLSRETEDGAWTVLDGKPSADIKGPHRYGPFKEEMRHRFVFVYGTQGSEEENAWSLAKARHDAESFWYRGNGSIDIIVDTEFDPQVEKDRTVVLYGNADTNAAWELLLDESPVEIMEGEALLGDRTFEGEDLACLFLRPRPGSDVASVLAISGTGIVGMRLTDRLPYFTSGVQIPDVVLMGPEVLSKRAEGVRAAGFFGIDWSLENGDFVWQ